MSDKNIIEFAEPYRNFHFIPGNVYNQDVVEKVRLAEALLIALDALRIYSQEFPGGECDAADEALSLINNIHPKI